MSNTARNYVKSKQGDEEMTLPKQNINLVVRVNQDSDDNLQALFDSVLNPTELRRPLQVPFRMRKLPNSFFNPPTNTSIHSRANSTDSAYETVEQKEKGLPNEDLEKKPSLISNAAHNRLAVYHSRAHSSPASLQENYCIQSRSEHGSACNSISNFINNGEAPPTNITSTAHIMDVDSLSHPEGIKMNNIHTFHMKQRSYDVVSPLQLLNELGALPPGWEQAKTNDGQIYYINHTTKTTQWEDPRIPLRQQQTRSLSETVIPNEITLSGKPIDAAAINENLGPLPQGWEQAVTESGDVYFINHIERTTSWNDPRITRGLDCPDNLVSSLQLDDNICDEIFSDVDTLLTTPTAKPDNLEWYKIN